MRQLEIHELTGPEAFKLNVLAPMPVPRADQVLIDVQFVAPAFPDLLMSQGLYQFQPPLPWTPGNDFSGVVREGTVDGQFKAGQRIAGMVDVGAAAEIIAAPKDRLFPVPDDLPLEEAAAMPLNYMTADFALTVRGGLRPGESVLVHGAAGGVGLAAVQLAQALGATVIGVVSSEPKADVVRSTGACVLVGRDDLPRRVMDVNLGQKVDLVFDVVGGDVTDSLRSLNPTGRFLSVGFTSGEIPAVKLNRLLLNNLDVRGVEWDLAIKSGIIQDQWRKILRLRKRHDIRPLIASVRPLQDYSAVLSDMANRRGIGRTVLSVH